MATFSVHKYWTSAWEKEADNADLSELIKMTEISTARSHVLNCKLYKVLAMKVDELCSTAKDSKDIDELCSENKILCSRLAIFQGCQGTTEFVELDLRLVAQCQRVGRIRRVSSTVSIGGDGGSNRTQELPIRKIPGDYEFPLIDPWKDRQA
ncbi:Uncharacterized protein Fot_06157 [Forsythia ovata]|uniref:Uncharacterized protein n=1 Tax=Forsythia ovata TaxID=205694 RepID=A0ABD1WS89_9LAMI